LRNSTCLRSGFEAKDVGDAEGGYDEKRNNFEYDRLPLLRALASHAQN
jgi:hypothetical protein